VTVDGNLHVFEAPSAPSAAQDSPTLEPLVSAEQSRTAFSTIPESVIAAALASLLLVIAMWRQVPHRVLLGWIAVLWCVLFGLFLLFFGWRRASPVGQDVPRWNQWFLIGNIVHGSTWGSTALLLFSGNFDAYQMWLMWGLFMIALSAITAGIAAIMPMVYGYVIPIVLPLIVRLALSGNFLGHMLALGGTTMLVLVLVFASRMNKIIVSSITLRFENEVQRRRAEEASVSKSRFLAAASHDLRQPLHAMALFVASLQDLRRSKKGAEDTILSHLAVSVEALQGLFDGLLDVSKLDAGVVRQEVAHFALQPVLDRLANECEAEASTKGLIARFVHTRAVLQGDAALLQRALRNLVSNAIRYTEKGGFVVGCRRERQGARVVVYDTGIGIEPAQMTKIFQEFYQVANPERDRTKGMGLGLAIVERLARLQGFPLKVASAVGRGSAFSMLVPWGEPLKVKVTETPPRDAETQFVGDLAVIVDDERAVVEGMRQLMQQWGFNVICGASAEEVIGELANCTQLPDILICDYRLRGGETGVNAIRRLQAAVHREVPAIIISGDTAPERLREADASGYHLLHKPVRPAKLRALLAFVLAEERRKSQDPSAETAPSNDGFSRRP
jgi:signal transduction histidine kinase/CheY-like chemotaxis protein